MAAACRCPRGQQQIFSRPAWKSYPNRFGSYRGIPIPCYPNPPGVCNLLFINRYVRPEGPWKRLLFTYNHFPAQIRITDHSRTPLSPSLTRPAKERSQINKEKQEPISFVPQERRKKGDYISEGSGPPSFPSSPAPAISSPSLPSRRTRLVSVHPILVSLRTSKTASVGFSFHSHFIAGALGCFRPCGFPITHPPGVRVWFLVFRYPTTCSPKGYGSGGGFFKHDHVQLQIDPVGSNRAP